MSKEEVKQAAEVLRGLDPYGHPVGSHCSHKIEKFAVFDQFPYTHHLECGAILTR